MYVCIYVGAYVYMYSCKLTWMCVYVSIYACIYMLNFIEYSFLRYITVVWFMHDSFDEKISFVARRGSGHFSQLQ